MTNWLKHVEEWRDCQRCPLAQQRGNICLARGNIPADVLFIGEAPGLSEDVAGRPFVGPAGMCLDQIIASALPTRMTWAMTNLVACFPREAKGRGDNEPERGEIFECRPRLIEFVNLVRPRLIVRVGKLAVSYCGFDMSVPTVDIDHPAYILRMPHAQRQMAARRCVVILRTAVEDMLESTRPEWQEWGAGHADIKSPREQFRELYGIKEET